MNRRVIITNYLHEEDSFTPKKTNMKAMFFIEVLTHRLYGIQCKCSDTAITTATLQVNGFYTHSLQLRLRFKNNRVNEALLLLHPYSC